MRTAPANRDSNERSASGAVVPLFDAHFQLRAALRLQIAEGPYCPGESFPTEREIAEHFHASRTTIREALVDLVQGGFLVCQQGKGTFVALAASHFGADVERVHCIERLRFANEEAIALQRGWLSLPEFDFPLDTIDDGSLYAMLEERYGTIVTSADEVISADVARSDEAELLGVAAGSPLLCVQRFTYSQTGEAIEAVEIR